MKSCLKVLMVALLVLTASFAFYSSPALAQSLPFLIVDGNYTYFDPDSDGIGLLTFTSLNPNWATYADGSSGCPPFWCANGDAIISTDGFGGGTLTSDLTFTAALSSSSAGVFGSGTFSISENGTGPSPGSGTFFTATLDGLDTSQAWNSLSNIVSDGSAPSSRYVTELLAIGNGVGNMSFSFTPTGGGSDNFIGSSSGAVGIVVAAPEPISAVLFIVGGATLGVRRFRRKNS